MAARKGRGDITSGTARMRRRDLHDAKASSQAWHHDLGDNAFQFVANEIAAHPRSRSPHSPLHDARTLRCLATTAPVSTCV